VVPGQASLGGEGSDTVAVAVVGAFCARWPILPKGKDLLATTTAVIKDTRESVCRDPPAANNRFWELTTNLFWHILDKIFEEYHCGEGKPCDRV
jgi:hypothetical protein